jgi:hypothetical protein
MDQSERVVQHSISGQILLLGKLGLNDRYSEILARGQTRAVPAFCISILIIMHYELIYLTLGPNLVHSKPEEP